MPVTKDEAKSKVADLVAKYRKLSPSEVKSLNEANTKQGFILPLFSALGWDVNETKEVTMEEAASGGRVDFAFKLNGVAQFYLEAKKLNVDLNNPEHMKQATTYAYGNGVTWAVLTNFEEMRLLNAQKTTPFITLTQNDYVRDFDKLWLLSRESLSNGLLNKEATQYGAITKLIPIEERLFKQLRVWREELYNQLFHHNDWLKPEQRDEIIEKLFNRLIFIRTCEDRKLEEHQLLSVYRQWLKGGKKKDELMPSLQKVFTYYRGYYDSDLFSLHILDDSRVFVYDETIAGILIGLYDIPGGMAGYDFAIIDADMLGRVYEQYLGYVSKAVVAKAKQAQAKRALGFAVDTNYELLEKKQQRKEQGIYYTPKFITDYIVKETVGAFIKENESDGYNKILNMKILDPACGSGSFLIRAYDELLNYHAGVRGKTAVELGQNDRLPILTRNIFGVDLDERAVEIARLNLLLRSLAKRDLLPPLTDNIRRGNSLISGTAEELKGYFGNVWKAKRPFNWDEQFNDIMAQGGFDVVIGNPPYVRIQTLPRTEADYYRAHYKSAFGSFDIYVLFLEQAIRLLKTGGRLGFITSGKFLKSEYGKQIQKLLKLECAIETIIDLSVQKIFGEATTYPIIIILKKGKSNDRIHYVLVPSEVQLAESRQFSNLVGTETEQEAITEGSWPPVPKNNPVMKKLWQQTIPLGDAADRIFQGIKTSADKVYVLSKVRHEGDEVVAFSNSLNRQVHLESNMVKPLIKTGQMERYHIQQPDKIILFPYLSGKLVTSDILKHQYPLIWKYLLDNKKLLTERERGAFAGEEWYQYGRNQAIQTMSLPKIITPDFASSARFSLDQNGDYYFSGGTAGGYGIIPSKKINPLYLLGLLNSHLLDWFLHGISSNFQGGFISYESRYIKKLPIRLIASTNPTEKKMHDNLVTLVDKMLELNRQLAPIHNTYSNERDDLVKEIAQMDKELDNLVYDLYGLTAEERQVIEASVSKS